MLANSVDAVLATRDDALFLMTRMARSGIPASFRQAGPYWDNARRILS